MRTIVVFFICFVTLVITSCENKDADTSNVATKSAIGKTDKIVLNDQDDTPRFHYPNYNPANDEATIKLITDKLKNSENHYNAKIFSHAAFLCKYFYGFYPETIEEMYVKGLVPYRITNQEQYDFVKLRLSIAFPESPGSLEPNGPDTIRFTEPVDFNTADAKTVMKFKGELMRRVIGSASNALPSRYSFSSMEVIVPGIRDNTYMYTLSKDLELNPAFWTNPYTGEPMKQCSTESPTRGDFSCKVLNGNIYEVQFYIE